jgi:hypothetical protein
LFTVQACDMTGTPAILSSHGHNHAGLVAACHIPRLPPTTDNYPLLTFRDIYATIGVIGLRIGDKACALAGQPVRVRGYMAPPVAERDSFFVLTRSPFITCPFCDPAASWPDDVVLACLEKDSSFVDPSLAIELVGELEIGPKPDPRTGTTRLVRLIDARWQPVRF